jgi:CRISPR-associated protein Csm4
MDLYRITLQLCSPLVTPLKGDTIWGHIVWGIANHEGDKKVAEFLEQEKSDTPTLIVSSAFPSGLICKPIPEPEERTQTNLNSNDYAHIKQKKKIKYAKAAEYFSEISESGIDETLSFESAQVMHNTINRETNAVLEGGLYAAGERWLGIAKIKGGYASINWDVYVLSSFTQERVKLLCEWAFENGYGADASTGKGKIIVKGDPQIVTAKKTGTKYMALGPFVKDGGIVDLRADIFVRSGKIGGAFASALSPYKKTVVLFDEGAVFTSQKSTEYAGKLLTKVHTDPRICQSAFAPVVTIG